MEQINVLDKYIEKDCMLCEDTFSDSESSDIEICFNCRLVYKQINNITKN